MKRRRSRFVSPAVLLISLLFLSTGYAQIVSTSISGILRNPDRYDGKMVRVEGTVYAVKTHVSRKGNPYITFQLKDADQKSVSVFSFGVLPVREGDRARVRGIYYEAKQASSFKFYKTINASNGGVERIE